MPSKSTCIVENCQAPAHARGLCQKHYQRWRKHGDPQYLVGAHRSIEERFWERFDKTPTCWIWHGTVGAHGYGIIAKSGVPKLAHRVSYELHFGKIPEGMVIDHLCRNPKCVNPLHLEVVTPRENTLRGFSPPAIASRQSHCQNGHEYTPENTRYRNDRNGRICRTCERERVIAFRSRHGGRKAVA